MHRYGGHNPYDQPDQGYDNPSYGGYNNNGGYGQNSAYGGESGSRGP